MSCIVVLLNKCGRKTTTMRSNMINQIVANNKRRVPESGNDFKAVRQFQCTKLKADRRRDSNTRLRKLLIAIHDPTGLWLDSHSQFSSKLWSNARTSSTSIHLRYILLSVDKKSCQPGLWIVRVQ